MFYPENPTPSLKVISIQPLREKALFDQVYLDRGVPSWDGGTIDVTPETFFIFLNGSCGISSRKTAPPLSLNGNAD
jgi:hypothetical protein